MLKFSARQRNEMMIRSLTNLLDSLAQTPEGFKLVKENTIEFLVKLSMQVQDPRTINNVFACLAAITRSYPTEAVKIVMALPIWKKWQQFHMSLPLEMATGSFGGYMRAFENGRRILKGEQPLEMKAGNAVFKQIMSDPVPLLNKCAQCANSDASKKCGGCKSVVYCNRECQVAHWPKHKGVCKQ
eukprot:TRINITY_DN1144_c0_g2_i4.p1 TRINITY_DN1144_c0_g2~~TRINITY_DN1144_c0_g2_i4.p1  ORF type:complete len:185 (+),score=34.12 TRINITY_DN1144_c0_g2_i4:226-780(+)